MCTSIIIYIFDIVLPNAKFRSMPHKLTTVQNLQNIKCQGEEIVTDSVKMTKIFSIDHCFLFLPWQKSSSFSPSVDFHHFRLLWQSSILFFQRTVITVPLYTCPKLCVSPSFLLRSKVDKWYYASEVNRQNWNIKSYKKRFIIVFTLEL